MKQFLNSDAPLMICFNLQKWAINQANKWLSALIMELQCSSAMKDNPRCTDGIRIKSSMNQISKLFIAVKRVSWPPMHWPITITNECAFSKVISPIFYRTPLVVVPFNSYPLCKDAGNDNWLAMCVCMMCVCVRACILNAHFCAYLWECVCAMCMCVCVCVYVCVC